ncbi:shikimate kinase [Pseudanabaena sp. PCC 6802]|uniref:shikimate kinase n=1 Tax=Pseudanabaena sp. PCC 6802 TaxID=118173 RepID=UPI0003470E55|nr:shikimate kinase [Pseudanabaena sp. PCC 6802]
MACLYGCGGNLMLDGTNVFLIGMMGAGKSTVGKFLAQRLQYHFFDTDDLVERSTGRRIPEIFANAGEAAFREIEHQVLAEVSAYTRLVVATGGGIVLSQMNWSYLRHGIVVWLDVPVDVLHQRLSQSDVKRPLLNAPDPKAVLTEIYTKRRDRYAQADIHLAVTAIDQPQTVCDRLIALMGEAIEPDRLKRPKTT